MTPPEGNYRERFVTAQDGLRLFARDYGPLNGGLTPVLCLSGLTRNSHDFHRLATALASNRRVLCPDYRGRGRSDRDPRPANYHPATYLNDLRHLLAALGLHRIAVIGTSLGGYLAMAFGAAMPTSLAGALINDASPEISEDAVERIAAYVDGLTEPSDWQDAVRLLRAALPDLGLATEEGWLEAARGTWREDANGRLVFDFDRRLTEAFGDAPVEIDLWALYRSLRPVPVTILRGEVSFVLTAETLAEMQRIHGDAVSVTLSGIGHAPTLNEPDSRAAIDAWLARCDSVLERPAP